MRALITGVNGQDGSYLAELLLDEGWEVHGTIRRASTPNLQRIEHLRDQITLHFADLADASSLDRVVWETTPDHVYNLGAQSDVRVSFDVPMYSAHVDAVGPLALLDAVHRHAPEARFYQAGSSEMFGMNPNVPCNEESAFWPGSPYAAAKVMAYHVTKNYREAHDMFAVNGILFNHESERRGVEFVTQKIALAAGQRRRVALGDIAPKRDWGYAPDYVQAMYLMMTSEEPDDFVVATGETHSVEEFLTSAYERAGMEWREYVDYDESLLRPTDPPVLLGDASKARDLLGWQPRVTFQELVARMVDAVVESERTLLTSRLRRTEEACE
jgi:GDPmannose 4,6-dehydratase